MARGWQPRKGDVSPNKGIVPGFDEWDDEDEE
jgi:hypothetical protein